MRRLRGPDGVPPVVEGGKAAAGEAQHRGLHPLQRRDHIRPPAVDGFRGHQGKVVRQHPARRDEQREGGPAREVRVVKDGLAVRALPGHLVQRKHGDGLGGEGIPGGGVEAQLRPDRPVAHVFQPAGEAVGLPGDEVFAALGDAAGPGGLEIVDGQAAFAVNAALHALHRQRVEGRFFGDEGAVRRDALGPVQRRAGEPAGMGVPGVMPFLLRPVVAHHVPSAKPVVGLGRDGAGLLKAAVEEHLGVHRLDLVAKAHLDEVAAEHPADWRRVEPVGGYPENLLSALKFRYICRCHDILSQFHIANHSITQHGGVVTNTMGQIPAFIGT